MGFVDKPTASSEVSAVIEKDGDQYVATLTGTFATMANGGILTPESIRTITTVSAGKPQ